MKPCDRLAELAEIVERRLLGEATPAEEDALVEHCRSCAECRSLAAVAADLRDAGTALQPDGAGLAEVRRAVLRVARRESGRAEGSARRAWQDWRDRLRGWTTSLSAAAAALLALAVSLAFFAGWRSGRSAGGDHERVARAVERAALADTSAGDPLDSPFVYSNVRFAPEQDGRLHLGFDVSAHLELDRQAEDPLVAEVATQSLLAGGSPVGSRLRAIDVAARLPGRRVHQALLRVLQDDPSLAVRLRALTALARGPGDPADTPPLLQVLAAEPAIEIRLLVIDYLAERGVDRATLRRAVEPSTGANRSALLVRVARHFDHPEAP